MGDVRNASTHQNQNNSSQHDRVNNVTKQLIKSEDDLQEQPFTDDGNPLYHKFEAKYDTEPEQRRLKMLALLATVLFGLFLGHIPSDSYNFVIRKYNLQSQKFNDESADQSDATAPVSQDVHASLAPPKSQGFASILDPKTAQLALHSAFAKVAQIVITPGQDPQSIQVHFSAIEKKKTANKTCGENVPGGIFALKFWVKGEKDTTIRAVDAIRVGCFIAQHTATPKLHMFTTSFDNLKDASIYEYEIGQAGAVGLSGAGNSLTEKKLFHLGRANLAGVELDGTVLSGKSNRQTIVTVGDMDMKYAKLVADGIAAEEHFSLFVHLGDGSYASNRGECYNGDLQPECKWDCPRTNQQCGGRERNSGVTNSVWDNWHSIMDPITSAVPFVTTMGNHDNDVHWALKFRPPVPNTRTPNVLDSDITDIEKASLTELLGLQSTGDVVAQQVVVNEVLTNPHFFSFDHGLVHVVSLGSEDNAINPYEMLKTNGGENSKENRKRFDLHYGVDSPQYKWLVRDLKKAHAKRNEVPWIVVYTHRPPYHTASHHPNCQVHGDWFGCKWRNLYTNIFEEAGVNLVISGHSHHYMRTWPMKDDNRADEGDPSAPVYIVCGTGGYPISHGWMSKPEWMAFRQATDYGYCKFSIVNATALDWSFVATRKDGSKSILDSTVILQPDPSTRSHFGSD